MKNKKQQEVKPSNVFVCCAKTMELKEFQDHLANDHKLTKEQCKGKKQMLSHIDGDTWFSSSYAWEFEGGLKFMQHIQMPRRQDDPMRYG